MTSNLKELTKTEATKEFVKADAHRVVPKLGKARRE
jgi:hypothetical protein